MRLLKDVRREGAGTWKLQTTITDLESDLAGQPDDDLRRELDGILDGLATGGSPELSARVVVASGHMVDLPGPRRGPLPAGPGSARHERGRETRSTTWDVGADTTVVTGGANGTDIIVAEECLARGARAVVCLALPPDEFERTLGRGTRRRLDGALPRRCSTAPRCSVLPDPPPSERRAVRADEPLDRRDRAFARRSPRRTRSSSGTGRRATAQVARATSSGSSG